MVQQLDKLAAKSGLTRHRYMIRVLEEVVAKDVLVRESVKFTKGLEEGFTEKTP